MSDCHPDKLVRYMGIARSEKWRPTEITYSGTFKPEEKAVGVRFDTLNLENMTRRFTVTGDVVNQGLIGIKGIGDTAANKYEGVGEYEDIDDFVEKKGGKDKSACERFIKLGTFRYMPGHENSKAVWTWYQYKYCSGKDITQMRREIRAKLLEQEGWNDQTIQAERERQIAEYKKQFPNRRKIPDKFNNWKPKPDDRREKVMALVEEDFTLEEILGFEEQYLGYYLHSPLDLYYCDGKCTIEDGKEWGKEDPTKLEVVIADIDFDTTRNGKDYAKIIVSDGMQQALVLMWHSEMALQNADNLKPGTGVQMFVNYDETRNSFSLARNEVILRLKSRR
jgi:DNA polymerase III alpha subunit